MSMLRVLFLVLLTAWMGIGIMAFTGLGSSLTDHRMAAATLCDSAGRRACP